MSGFEVWSAVWWILLILVVLATTYLYMTWPYNHFKNLGIPGPKPVPIFGNMGELHKKSFGELDEERILKYGKVHGIYGGWDPVLVVADLDMMREILIKDFDSFCDHRPLTNRGILAHSLLDKRGDEWKRQRVQLSPYFSAGTMKMSVGAINKILSNLIELLYTKCQQKEIFEARSTAEYFTLDVICTTAFGIQVNSVKEPNIELVRNAKKLTASFGINNIIFALILFLPGLARILDWFNVEAQDMSYMEKFIRELIKERRKSTQDSPDFIHIMLKAEEARKQQKDSTTKGLSDEEIIANVAIFLLGGHDTTAGTLAFLLYNLTVYEECQQRVYEEIKECIGNEELTYENIHKLTYLDMCFDESQRLYPQAQTLDRKCVKDTVIKGVPIKAGTLVSIPVWYLHRTPDVWKNPEQFDPERFSAENKKSRDPMYHCPFGLGPRHCIGMRLAELEIKMATVGILQKFKLVKNDKTQVPLKLDPKIFFTRSKDGIWLSLEERNEGL